MAKKPITLTDVEKRNAELERMLDAVRADRDQAREELRQLRAALNQLREKADGLQDRAFELQAGNAGLQRLIGQLEGYRQRVERVDDLDRGLRPLDGSRPDAAAGPNPHYRGPSDGFFQR